MNRTAWLQETKLMRFEEAYTSWQEKRLTQEEAASLLGVCERSFRRYINRFEEDGLQGLLDKRMAQVSSHKAPWMRCCASKRCTVSAMKAGTSNTSTSAISGPTRAPDPIPGSRTPCRTRVWSKRASARGPTGQSSRRSTQKECLCPSEGRIAPSSSTLLLNRLASRASAAPDSRTLAGNARRHSPLVKLACGLDTAKHLRDAQLKVFPGMGHDFPEPLLARGRCQQAGGVATGHPCNAQIPTRHCGYPELEDPTSGLGCLVNLWLKRDLFANGLTK